MLAELVPQLIWSSAASGKCTYVNRRCCEYTGMSREHALGTGWQAALHPSDRDRTVEAWREAVDQRRSFELELRLRRHDGAYRWFLVRAEPLLDAQGHTRALFGTCTELSDQQRGAAKEMEDSEELSQKSQLRLILEHVPVAIAMFDRQMRYLAVSERFLADYGLSGRDLRGQCHYDVFPDVPERWREAHRRALAGEALSAEEDLWVRANGQHCWTQWRLRSWRDRHGEIGGVILSAKDITEQKLAAAALNESEERFRRAVMFSPLPIMLHAEDGEVVSVNQAWTEVSGYRREQLATIADWTELAYGERKTAVQRTIRALFDAESTSHEGDFTIRDARGQTRVWDFHSTPLGRTADGRRLVMSTANDVTALREAERALREKQERLEVALFASETGTFRWDSRTDALEWDQNLERLFGLPPGTTVRTLEGFFQCVHPDDRPGVRDACARCSKEGADFVMEYRVVWPDGSVHWLDDRGKTFPDEAGRPSYMTGACVDITARKLAEAALREADRRKDEFLAMLAHELRNPLGPIRNAVEVLRIVGPPASMLQHARDVISRQVGHMVRIVDDLLDVSRIARGKVELRMETCNLSEIIRQEAEDYRGIFAQNGVECAIELSMEPLWTRGDPTRLAQVVSNVLHNANKFTQAGGRVTIALSADGDHAVVRVRDTGIGMEEGMLSRVFEPFSQADGSLARSSGGLGLGLALVKGLVELHGGRVAATSAGLGRGVEIAIWLPLVPPEGLAAKHHSSADAGARGLRILIIEDNVDAAESMKLLLELSGHDVVATAASGRAGVDAVKRLLPEIVLCDIGLPGGMDGYAVAKELRADPRCGATMLVALTGYGQDDDKLRSREAGFDVHIVKPVEYVALQKLLATYERRA